MVKTVEKKKVVQNPPQLKHKQQFLLTALKLLVSGLLLFWALRKTNLVEIAQAVKTAQIPFLIAAFLTYLASYYIRCHRWQFLLEAQGIKTQIVVLYKSYMVSIFFSNFLPSTVGGDVFRAYDTWRMGATRAKAAATVFIDRFLGLLTLVLFAVGALLFSQQMKARLPMLYPWLLLGVSVTLIFLALFFLYSEQISSLSIRLIEPLSRRLKHILDKGIHGFLAFTNYKRALLKALAISVIVQISVIAHYYFIAKALAFPISWQSFFLIIPLATLVMMLPVSINAIGLRENAFVFLLGAFSASISRPEALAFTWIAYAIVLVQGLAGGIVYALRK